MQNPIYFRLFNRLTRNNGYMVLVFLTPADTSKPRDLFFAAWQTLNPAANGGNQPFLYQGNLQLAVEDEDTECQSPTVEVRPNQYYTVSNNDSQGPVLNLSYSQKPQSSKQVAVENTTDPAITLANLWMVDGKPIVKQGGLNLDSTATFVLDPTFIFIVARPVGEGFTWRLPQFSPPSVFLPPSEDSFASVTYRGSYRVPPGADLVEVTWNRPGGMSGADVLTFNPLSG